MLEQKITKEGSINHIARPSVPCSAGLSVFTDLSDVDLHIPSTESQMFSPPGNPYKHKFII